ncbi:hypothetical protein LMIY3S_02703 [Labrys miyagiensis]
MPIEQRMNRDDAVALHRNGQIDAAITAYRALLAVNPEDPDILGLLGVATEQSGDPAEAERLLRRSLTKNTSTELLYRNFNNLAGLLIESGRLDDARVLAAETEFPDWPAQHAPAPAMPDTIVSTIEALKTLDQKSKALQISDFTSKYFRENLNFATQRAELLHDAGRLQDARTELSQDFGPEEESPNLHALRSALAFEASDYASSARSATRFAATFPAFLSPRGPAQKFVLAVFNPAPESISDFSAMENHHYAGNFPSQLATEFADSYRFLSIFPNTTTIHDALRDLPRPALALNNFVNAEKLLVGDTFARVCATVDALGVPVINHPRQVAQVTRQKNSERFANVEGILAPRITRYFSIGWQQAALIADIESRYEYPMILRTVFHQMGKGTWLAYNRQELADALENTDGQQIYIINYFDLRHDNGFYRRIRAAFVDKAWTILRIDYDKNWNVRGRREEHIGEFYREHPELMALSDSMIRDPHGMLAPGALAKLDEIAKAMPLDIFGMDFDITYDGRLAVFEANATMNFLDNAEGGLSYPREPQGQLTDALHRLFTSVAADR